MAEAAKDEKIRELERKVASKDNRIRELEENMRVNEEKLAAFEKMTAELKQRVECPVS